MPKIKYKLFPNRLKPAADHYRAIMDLDETVDLKALINFMGFHHSSLTTADMFAFVEDFDLSILRMLLDGKRVNTGLVTYSLSITGNFDSPDDQFDPNRHELVIRIRPGAAFKEMVQTQANLEKQRAIEPKPELDRYINSYNGALDTVLSPGHTACLKGFNLNFDPADPRQGLFIIPANRSGAVTNPDVRVEKISLMTTSQIIFRVPDDLPSGLYKLEVRSVFGNTDLRSGLLKTILEVR